MTLLAPATSKTICRIRLAGERRWVSLSLSLGELGSTGRFLVTSERLVYEMTGADEPAQQYGLSNWQGGIISGARYALRALKAPLLQIRLHELRGELRSDDVWAVSAAAALAVARLLSRPPAFPLDLGGWKLEEDNGQPQEKVSPSQPEPRQDAVEKNPPEAENAGRTEDTQG